MTWLVIGILLLLALAPRTYARTRMNPESSDEEY